MKTITWNKNQVPIYSWTENYEEEALNQAKDLSKLPFMFHHVALMPDVHPGYGMPIGGVIACKDVVIPNAVGVDIGCGMMAVKTDLFSDGLKDKQTIRNLFASLKKLIPVGEGNFHRERQYWDGFNRYEQEVYRVEAGTWGWDTEKVWNLALHNLGTLGGGNHFIELQSDGTNIWLMLHSGSRNLGYKIAKYYNDVALELCSRYYSPLPNKDVAFLPIDSTEGLNYIRDMTFALNYAQENRKRMMNIFQQILSDYFSEIGGVNFAQEINIHHNYANLENHFGKNIWVHRKGATSAKEGQLGIIPGSMGTASYIVKGKGNRDSFTSCSHGAGRPMSRTEASKTLTKEECDKAMEGIVYDWWKPIKRGKLKGELDFSESPGAYKDIDTVISEQSDLVDIVVKLKPLGVLKG